MSNKDNNPQGRELDDLSIDSLNRSTASEPLLERNKHKVSEYTTLMMLLKGMIGLGIFSLPHTAKTLGYVGYAVLYPLVSTLKTSYIVLVINVANDMNFNSER